MAKPYRILDYRYRSPIFTWEMFVQISVLTGILSYVWYSREQTSLVYLAITIDSLFSAIGFLRINIIHDMTQSQTLKQLRSLYRVSVADRYLYYIVLGIVYQLLLVLSWGYLRQVLYYGLIISLCPILLNTILLEIFGEVTNWLNNEKTRAIKIAVSKFVAYVINIMSEVSVNLRPEVHYTELLPLFRNRHHAEKFFYSFLSSFLISSLIQYIQSNGNHLYARVIRYFYNYKTGDHIGKIDKQKAYEKFTHVIVSRRWSELLRPDVTQTLFYIYKSNEDSNFIKDAVTGFHYSLLKISTIWTISWFFKWSGLAPILSCILLLVKQLSWSQKKKKSSKKSSEPSISNTTNTSNNTRSDQQTEKEHLAERGDQYNPQNKKSDNKYIHVEDYYRDHDSIIRPLIGNLFFPVLAFIISYQTVFKTKYLMLTCFSELTYNIVTHSLFTNTIAYIIDKIKELISVMTRYRDLSVFLLSTVIYLYTIRSSDIFSFHLGLDLITRIDINMDYLPKPIADVLINTNPVLLVSLIFMLINLETHVKQVILILFTVLAYISDYNVWHLSYMVILSHLVLNGIYYFRPNYLQELKPSLVDFSYGGQNRATQITGNIRKTGDSQTGKVHINADTFKIFDSYHPSIFNKTRKGVRFHGRNINHQNKRKIHQTEINHFSFQSSQEQPIDNIQINTDPSNLVGHEIVDRTNQPFIKKRIISDKLNQTANSLDHHLPLGLNSGNDFNSDMCRSYYIQRSNKIEKELGDQMYRTSRMSKSLE